ncbi:glycosyltransferase family 2 protein [Candidatus Pelagibacter sp.]|uniref:glycosyltransferase family 2 protein n=1 Tax=Candidatus Pelagibacter sp. TaxID=2024849 RepID=UPI003F87F4FE
MKFSIIVPTLNNLDYLKILISSIEKNSTFDHEIIIHVNENLDNTIEFLKQKKIKYTYSETNIGLCSAVNKAAKLATTQYILYTHDDMYFLPSWDSILKKEIELLDTKFFYLSGTMIQRKGADLTLDAGNDHKDFNEQYLLDNYQKINITDHQGSHWAPHLINKDVWNLVKGFSVEFDPGDGSDSDLNMKLWNCGVRIFKGLNDFKVYHFGSISMRKKKNIIKNNGTKTFLKKWGITPKFFFKYYLKTGCKYDGPLKNPKKPLSYFIGLMICKIKKGFSY